MLNTSYRIAIIIATKNRPKKLQMALLSLLGNKKRQYAILIADQSNDNETWYVVQQFQKTYSNIFYFKPRISGKSNALNEAISLTQSPIIAFTDDDCVASYDWIDTIVVTFEKNNGIDCITGNVYPYKTIPRWSCPPTLSTEYKIFARPIHHKCIGFGCNMAMRSSVLQSTGLFKSWLGPGSISTSCEDGDMLLRLLLAGHKILHNPNVIVYHTKQLTQSMIIPQQMSYVCGEMACYGYYSLLGYTFAKKVVRKNIDDSIKKLRCVTGDLVKRRTLHTDLWIRAFSLLINRIRGFLIGFFYYIKACVFNIPDTSNGSD